MATEAEINVVRHNTNEANIDSSFDDATISSLIDEGSVDSASAVIWRRKAAQYVDLVDVSEAGASRKYSDLHKNALAMASVYAPAAAEAVAQRGNAAAKVHKIVRS